MEKEKDTDREVEALRKAGRDRERDLDTLNAVLQCNQDVINVRAPRLTSQLAVSVQTRYTCFLSRCRTCERL